MRNYVILRRKQHLWEQFTAQYAESPEKAIENVVSVTGEAGTYIAVPARSWRQHTWPKPVDDPRRRPVDLNKCQEGC